MVKVEYLNTDRTLRRKSTFGSQNEVTEKFRKFILDKAFMKPTIIVLTDESGKVEEIEVNK